MALDISFLVCFSWLRISSSGKSPSRRCRDIWVPVAPAGNLTRQESIPHQRQVSPDKNVSFHCTAAPFTVSPEPRALTCCADLSGDWTLYAVSVRLPVRCAQTGRLIALYSGFLHLPVGRQGPPPHGDALAFGWYFRYPQKSGSKVHVQGTLTS